MPLKMTMLFRASSTDKNGQAARIAGTSESWYTSLGMADRTAFDPIAVDLCRKRAKLLPNNSSIIGTRYTELDANLKPTGRSVTFDDVYPGAAGMENDVPQAAIKLTLRATENKPNRKETILRMVPDARVVKGEYAPLPAYDLALRQYVEALSANWKFRGLDSTQPIRPVARLLPGGTVVFPAANPFAEGDIVQFLRVKISDARFETPVGVHKHTLIATTEFAAPRLIPGYNPALAVDVTAGGLRKNVYALFGITFDTQELVNPAVTVAKVGKAHFQYVGRRAKSRR